MEVAAVGLGLELSTGLLTVGNWLRVFYRRRDLSNENRERLESLRRKYETAGRLVQQLNASAPSDEFTTSILNDFLITVQQNFYLLAQLEENRRNWYRVNRIGKVLAQCETDMDKFFSFLHQSLEAAAQPESFVPDFSVPPNPVRLTLDYDSRNTCEGRLKATILHSDASQRSSIIVYGRGGVGKTCAIRGLASDATIKDRFTGSIFFIQLKNDSECRDIIQDIATIVARTGSGRLAYNIRSCENLQEASGKASTWFRQHQCLLLIDDIWWVNNIDSNVITLFETMVSTDSRVVYTTRDQRFLGFTSDIRFSEKESRGKLARRMLMTAAGFSADQSLKGDNEKALGCILDVCKGLPLALGITGDMVRKAHSTDMNVAEDNWTLFHEKLLSEGDILGKSAALGYGRFSRIVDGSLNVLCQQSNGDDFRSIFRAFCVLQNQQDAQLPMLQKLWGFDNLKQAEDVVDTFAKVSLVRKLHRSSAISVRVDDLVLGIARQRASERNEEQSFFRNLVDNYDPQLKFSAVLQLCQVLQETPKDKMFFRDAAQNRIEKLRELETFYGKAVLSAEEIIRKLESSSNKESMNDLNKIATDLYSNFEQLGVYVAQVNSSVIKRFKQMNELVQKCGDDLNQFLGFVTMNFAQTLPLLYSTALTSDSLPVLQSAFVQALQNPLVAEENCRKLISKDSCKQSLEEWYAAHRLLMIAVDNDKLDPSADVDGKPFYWRDQLYCMAQRLHIANAEDRKQVFRCLKEAANRGLIDTPDAYIQGINTMELVREETSRLKTAVLVLLNRVVKAEATAEELFLDLRSAFENYKRRQFYCNLAGIGIALIPLVGGALGKALLSGTELVGNMSSGDFMECTLSITTAVLSDENLMKLSRNRRDEVENIFAENRFTRKGVQELFATRGNMGEVQLRIEYPGNGEGENGTTQTPEAHQERDLREREESEREQIIEEIVVSSEQSAVDQEPRDNTSAENLNLSAVQTTKDLAEAWATFVLGVKGTEEDNNNDIVVSCLLELLENESIPPETLRTALPAEVEEVRIAAISTIEQRMGSAMKIGEKIRMRKFLDSFTA